VLSDRWSPKASEPIRSGADADSDRDPTDTSIRGGLSDAAISSTVAANWRSIERDCSSIGPVSSSKESAPNTSIVVTLTVSASGRVRSAAAHAAGHRDLEVCIESSVNGWSFPQAGDSTTISIPLSLGEGP
jgi:hypothetical protein